MVEFHVRIVAALLLTNAFSASSNISTPNRSSPGGTIRDAAEATEKAWRRKDEEEAVADDVISSIDTKRTGSSSKSRLVKDILDGNDDTFSRTSNDEFCEGMYMSMFMDGFHWTLFLKKPSPQCLNYFVASWKLEDAGKFKGAMLFTFLLAVLVEGISYFRGSAVRHLKAYKHAFLTLIYAVQALFGYLLMIITMSFSAELILSVIAGLMLGNLLFMRYDQELVSDLGAPNNSQARSQDLQSDIDESRPLLNSNGSNLVRRRA
jgi:Ctr copper transporter family